MTNRRQDTSRTHSPTAFTTSPRDSFKSMVCTRAKKAVRDRMAALLRQAYQLQEHQIFIDEGGE